MNIINLKKSGKQAIANAIKGMLATATLVSIANLASAQALVTNNGALVSITTGAQVIVKNGTLHNQAGNLINQGTLTIEQDIVNDATASGGGGYGLYRIHNNWVNNATFNRDITTVELYGDSQLITGTAVTSFYDLKLTGTGIKRQTINANTYDSLVLNDRELATDHYIMHVLNTDPGVISKAVGTSGFVSSLDSGRLSWDLASNFPYLYPTGSSIGTSRYRPVIIRPDNNNPQTILIRMANVDATTEGYDRSVKQTNICKINDKFYHLIGRTNGSDPVQVTLAYDSIADGNWRIMAHWQNLPEWEDVGNVFPGLLPVYGFKLLTVAGWNVLNPEPFALGRPNPGIDTAAVLVKNLRCYKDSSGAITINVNHGIPPYTFNWLPNNGTLQNDSSLSAGTYTVSITDTVGCSRSFGPFTVTQPAEIKLSGFVEDVKCFGLTTGTAQVKVDSSVLPNKFLWTTPSHDTTQTVANLAAGTYTVTVTDGNNCKQDTTLIVNQPTAIDITSTLNDLRCYQSANGQINLTVSGGTPATAPAYAIQWADSSALVSLTRTGLAAGTYVVTITDSNNCKKVDSFALTQPDSLTLKAAKDTIIAAGYSAPLDIASTTGGSGTLTYAWTPSTGLSDSTGSNITATPSQTTTYHVTAKDANGCVATDTVHVRVDVTLIKVPDAFTPNGDGNNDVFIIKTSPTVSLVEFKIFNRWGQLISENTSGWDGTYNGKAQPMDTYIFQATIRMPDGSNMPKTGDFVLVR